MKLAIPSDTAPTVVAVLEAGSIAHAARTLGINRPTILSHIERVETAVNGRILAPFGSGVIATLLGRQVLAEARLLLARHRTPLAVPREQQEPIRVGIANYFMPGFVSQLEEMATGKFVVHADNSAAIHRAFSEGYLDVACVFDVPDSPVPQSMIIQENYEACVWVKSRRLRLQQHEPVPLLHWPGIAIDDLIVSLLSQSNIEYEIVFSSPDHMARLAAVTAGFGLTAYPRRMVPPGLLSADEHWLPKIPPMRTLLLMGAHVGNPDVFAIIDRLVAIFDDSGHRLLV